MTNILKTIVAKSDQLNADDLIGNDITITVTEVSLVNSDQPVSINYKGDNGKPYLPSKGMRRVLVAAWGGENVGSSWPGRKMTLYRDPEVKFGGVKVGGIRISHLSHIIEPLLIPLTVTRGSKKMYTVNPIKESPLERDCTAAAAQGGEALKKFWLSLSKQQQQEIAAHKDSCKAIAERADSPPPEPEHAPVDKYAAPGGDITTTVVLMGKPQQRELQAAGNALASMIGSLREAEDAEGVEQHINDNLQLIEELEAAHPDIHQRIMGA